MIEFICLIKQFGRICACHIPEVRNMDGPTAPCEKPRLIKANTLCDDWTNLETAGGMQAQHNPSWEWVNHLHVLWYLSSKWPHSPSRFIPLLRPSLFISAPRRNQIMWLMAVLWHCNDSGNNPLGGVWVRDPDSHFRGLQGGFRVYSAGTLSWRQPFEARGHFSRDHFPHTHVQAETHTSAFMFRLPLSPRSQSNGCVMQMDKNKPRQTCNQRQIMSALWVSFWEGSGFYFPILMFFNRDESLN